MTVETMHTAIMKKVLLALISLVLISCRQGVVYDEFKSLPTSGWDADSALLFTPFVADTIGGYEVQIIVRHTARYPYQIVPHNAIHLGIHSSIDKAMIQYLLFLQLFG